MPATTDIGMRSRKPDLFEVCFDRRPRRRETFPKRRTKCKSRLVETQSLESIFHLVRDLRVGEAPLVGGSANANDGGRGDAQGADGIPDGEGFDSDFGGGRVGEGGACVFELQTY